MNDQALEGIAIARLIAVNPTRTIGWIYVWETGALGVLRLYKGQKVDCIDRKINTGTLARARLLGSKELVDLLENLPIQSESSKS